MAEKDEKTNDTIKNLRRVATISGAGGLIASGAIGTVAAAAGVTAAPFIGAGIGAAAAIVAAGSLFEMLDRKRKSKRAKPKEEDG